MKKRARNLTGKADVDRTSWILCARTCAFTPLEVAYSSSFLIDYKKGL